MENEKQPLLSEDSSDTSDVINTETNSVFLTTRSQNVVINTDESVPRTKVYKRRWYVMVIFCLFAMSQGGSWSIYGPISATTEDAFGWSDSNIALLTAWGPIAYLITTFPFAWLIETKGIRVASLTATFLTLMGAVARCITTDPAYVTWTSNIGQLLNGLAGPIAFGAPPVLSALWFPANERTTATALNTVLNSVGSALTFTLGPHLVLFRGSCHVNDTTSNTSSHFYGSITNNCTNQTRILAERHDISRYMLYDLCFIGIAFVLMLVYYPRKPDLPPTVSASLARLDFRSGIKDLIRNVKFWLICLTFGVSQGVFSSWQGVLDVNLKPHNISQNEAGWLGFYSLIAGCFASLVFAKFSDVFARHMRLFLLFLYICASGCFVWFIFLVEGVIQSSTVMLYTSIIMGTMFLTSTMPLFFEMACEAAYPVPEGITNLVLTLSSNIGGLIFLVIQMIPNIGTNWASWCMLGGIVSCIPVLALLKERYNRLDVDETEKKVDQ
ncbi:solute carrier family 49 member 4 homolog [Mytilus trossulus]|uniref:solute carrier family 49 member 4 homolog n=1 Tax=Mytilus trossulus TaxID=6551 RepID=UPI003007CFC4